MQRRPVQAYCLPLRERARRFQYDLFMKKRQMRQCGVAASRPCFTQKDVILFDISYMLGSGDLRANLHKILKAKISLVDNFSCITTVSLVHYVLQSFQMFSGWLSPILSLV